MMCKISLNSYPVIVSFIVSVGFISISIIVQNKTIGEMICAIKLTDISNTHPSKVKLLLRFLLKIISFMSIVGLILSLKEIYSNSKTWFDKIVGIKVEILESSLFPGVTS